MYAKINEELEKGYKVTDYPLNIALEVTNKCNLKCVMCGRNTMTRPEGVMPMRIYKKIVDETALENPSTRLWMEFLGEPLMIGFKLYYMIDYAKKQGLKNVCLNSNALLMTEEYAEMLLDAGVDYVSFDCDGFSKKAYEAIRVGGDRDIFFKNVNYFLAAKEKRGSNVIVDVKIIEMDENKDEIDQVVEYWKTRGAWTAVRKKLDWATYRLNDELWQHAKTQGRIACGHAIGVSAITWDGRMAGCGQDGNCEMGNESIMDSSIKTLWQKRNDEVIKLHLEHRWGELSKICQECNSWRYIGETRYDEYGHIRERNYDPTSTLY